jgi:hypothetical protein
MDMRGLMAGLGEDQSLDGKLLCGTKLRKVVRMDWGKPEGTEYGWTDDVVECRTISQSEVP